MNDPVTIRVSRESEILQSNPSRVWRLLQSRALRSVLTLMSSSAFSAVLPVLCSPITARLYSPGDYGGFAFLLVFSSVLGVVAYGQMPQLIFFAKEDPQARKMFWHAVWFNSIVCLLASAVVAAIIGLQALRGQLQATTWPSLLVPLLVFGTGINTTFGYWLNRSRQYRILSLNRILGSSILAISQIVLGFLLSNTLGLVLSMLGGLLAGQIHFWVVMRKEFSVRELLAWRLKELWGTVREYRTMLGFGMPSDLINTFSNQLPVLMLTRFAGPAAVGLYNMGYRLLGLPTTVVTGAVSEVFRQKASHEYHHTGSCRKLIVQTAATILAICTLPFLLLMWWAPGLFALALGENWRVAGEYARIIGVLFLFKLAFSPVSYAILLSRRFRTSLVMDLTVASVCLVGMYIGLVVLHSTKTALLIYALAYAGLYLVTFCLSFKYAKNPSNSTNVRQESEKLLRVQV